MSFHINQPVEQYFYQVRVGKLPPDVTAKQIVAYFKPFGTVVNLFLKRRTAKDSNVFLANPYVILIFEKSDSVDHIMAARPFFMDSYRLFVRRCMPITRRYPYEPFLTAKKILIRTESDTNDDILPDDHSIVEHLKGAGGKIEYFERLDEKTVLVQFDDYDPVDMCCLLRPHYINNQPVEIEKCVDEEVARNQVELRQKSRSVSTKFSPPSTTVDMDNQSMNTVSPVPTLSIDDHIAQLRSTYNDITSRLEYEHEQLVASLAAEWMKTAKERVRLERVTLDYKQESERLAKENRQWQKLFSESIREKPAVQSEGERKLQEASQKNEKAKAIYDQLMRNIRQ